MGTLDSLLRLAAAGIIAATVLSFAARAWWVFELMTHFRVQLFAAAVAAAAALLLRRRHWDAGRREGEVQRRASPLRRPASGVLAAALSAAAAVNAVPLLRYALPSASFAAQTGAATASATAAAAAAAPGAAAIAPLTAPRARAALTVLSANVHWTNDRYARLLDLIEKENPDAVVAVELTPAWRDGLAPLAARYPYRRLAPRSDPFGAGLWSRYPIESAEVALESGTAIDARIATPGGPVRVLGVHLRAPMSPSLAAERNRQYADLVRLTRAHGADPLVVVGDFNTTPYSPVFSDWLAATKLRDVHGGLDVTWPTYLPWLGIPIDHCVVNSKIEAAEFRRLPAFGSDHYPILCRVAAEPRA